VECPANVVRSGAVGTGHDRTSGTFLGVYSRHIVGATQWQHSRTGAMGWGLRVRVEWAEPGSVTDS